MDTEIPIYIEVPKLSLGKHSFDFDITDAFFDLGDQEAVVKGASLKLRVALEKTNEMLDATFFIAGEVKLSCDRCLEPYQHPLKFSRRIVYSYNKRMEEAEDDEVVYIPRAIFRLDLTQDVYDFVMLEIPYKKAPEACLEEACAPEIARALQPGDTEEQASESEAAGDPRWDALRSLKFDANE